MRRIGVYERVGYKLGAWHDVAWYGLRLADPDGVPPEPIPLPELDPADRRDVRHSVGMADHGVATEPPRRTSGRRRVDAATASA